jgi:hypothetical protein
MREKIIWRRGWDSNPRYARAYNGFRVWRVPCSLVSPDPQAFDLVWVTAGLSIHWYPLSFSGAVLFVCKLVCKITLASTPAPRLFYGTIQCEDSDLILSGDRYNAFRALPRGIGHPKLGYASLPPRGQPLSCPWRRLVPTAKRTCWADPKDFFNSLSQTRTFAGVNFCSIQRPESALVSHSSFLMGAAAI